MVRAGLHPSFSVSLPFFYISLFFSLSRYLALARYSHIPLRVAVTYGTEAVHSFAKDDRYSLSGSLLFGAGITLAREERFVACDLSQKDR